MITFIISLAVLILGYLFYGRFVERVFGPDDRVTPAIAKRDNVDFMVLPNWKVYMIQFLNIAGTGPIFGAIMGAKFGPVSRTSCLSHAKGKPESSPIRRSQQPQTTTAANGFGLWPSLLLH